MRIKKARAGASPLQAHVGYQLRIVSNAVSQSFFRRLAASGVTVAEWVILREMYSDKDQTSPSQVAELTGLTRGAVSKLIDRLLNKKLVTRSESAEDRRYQEIHLTPKAIGLVPKLAAIADENDEKFFSVLSAGERKNLEILLKKLAAHHRLSVHPTQ